MDDVKKIISSKRGGIIDLCRNVWRYRALVRVLAIRDIKIEYSQTMLGVFWAFLKPLVALAMYSIFFDWIIGINTDPFRYTVFVLPGIMAWFHFSTVINHAGTSLKDNPDLIKKVEFPKIILPLSKIISSLVDVLVMLVLLVVTMIAFKIIPTYRILFFPLFLVLNIITAMSVSVWLAALTFKYRDLHHLIPYLVSFGIWLTPVFYPTLILPESLSKLVYGNPIAGVLAGYRWALIGDSFPDWQYLFGFIPVLILLVTGLFYFARIEDDIADYI